MTQEEKRKNKILMKIFIVYALLFSIFLSACGAPNNKVEINRKVLPVAEEGGISYGVYNLEGEIERTDIFNVENEGNFDKIFSVGNYYEKDITLSMVILVNFIQTDFCVNGKKDCSSYDFTVKAGEAEQVEFMLADLEEGNYSINIVVFENLDNHSAEDQFRDTTDFSNFLTYSCLLQVGEGSKDTEEYINVSEENSTRTNTNVDAVVLNQEERALSYCKSLSLKEAEESFYIHAGNVSKNEKVYALVLFDRTEVIPINGEMVTYISVKPEKMADIAFHIDKLSKEEVHEITVARFEINMDTGKIMRVDNSVRIGINLP